MKTGVVIGVAAAIVAVVVGYSIVAYKSKKFGGR